MRLVPTTWMLCALTCFAPGCDDDDGESTGSETGSMDATGSTTTANGTTGSGTGDIGTSTTGDMTGSTGGTDAGDTGDGGTGDGGCAAVVQPMVGTHRLEFTMATNASANYFTVGQVYDLMIDATGQATFKATLSGDLVFDVAYLTTCTEVNGERTVNFDNPGIQSLNLTWADSISGFSAVHGVLIQDNAMGLFAAKMAQ